MADTVQTETLADKLEGALAKSKKALIAVAAVAIVAIAGISIFSVACAKATEKGIEQIDSITYALTKNAAELAGDDLAKRQNEALEALNEFEAKSGIVGVRANMLIADIKFAQKKYDESRAAWVKAAEAKKNVYTASVSNFNAGVCSEELNDLDSAVKYYKLAADDADFVLADHAMFSLGRVYEAKSAYADAKAAYEKLNEVELYSTAKWAQLAKARLVAMKAAGNIQ